MAAPGHVEEREALFLLHTHRSLADASQKPLHSLSPLSSPPTLPRDAESSIVPHQGHAERTQASKQATSHTHTHTAMHIHTCGIRKHMVWYGHVKVHMHTWLQKHPFVTGGSCVHLCAPVCERTGTSCVLNRFQPSLLSSKYTN